MAKTTRAARLRRLAMIPGLRAAILEDQVLRTTRALADPVTHWLITNLLYTVHTTSGISRGEIAEAWWTAYRHLLDGRPVDVLPLHPLLNRARVLADITAILRGEPITLETEEDDAHAEDEDDDRDRDEADDEEGREGREGAEGEDEGG